jgi:CBS domain-containing protein
MPKAFDTRNPPFDRLDPTQVEGLRNSLDIVYLRPGETVLAQGAAPEGLYVVIKGTIEERDGEELVALLGPKDSFDTRAVVQGSSARSFVSRDEALCYVLPRALVLKLIQENARFAAFFYLDISRKLDALAREDEESRVGSLMRARVAELVLQPAVFIDADDTIETAGHRMREVNSNALFVRDGDRVGIITGMNLSKAVVLRRLPLESPVRPVTHFDVVSLERDDFIFSALLLMTKHNKRRVAVRDGKDYVGILEDINLLGFLAGNAQLVAGRIDRARGLDDLTIAARETEEQVRVLRRQGVKIEVISEIVSDLNRRLFARTFELLAPLSVQDAGCLIVMGSEGRGEQTVRTDQDNGLILRAPVDPTELDSFRKGFQTALEGYGFPPCPGNVMVVNPVWSRPVAEFEAEFRRWVALPDESAHMNVAIFYDAAAVAGRSELLDEAKTALIDLVRGDKVYLAHFARSIEAFSPPIGLFNNLITAEGQGDALDLKKGGIFPVVHGVRSLALEQGLRETGTAERIEALVRASALSRDLGRSLVEAFHFLQTLRLDAQLAASGGKSGTLIRPAALSSMERDLLREAFQVVKQFREVVRRRFNLGVF